MKKQKPYVTIALAAINVIIFLICTFVSDVLYNIGGLSPLTFFEQKQFYRIFTAMFLHADINHLVNNMLILIGIGYMLEDEIGHVGFFLLYMSSGLGGQFISLVNKMLTGKDAVISIGASGAVFGLLGGLLAAAICFNGKLQNITWKRILFAVAYSVYTGMQAARIDNAAHIGGFIFGVLIGLIICLLKMLKQNSNTNTDGWEYRR